MTTARRRLRAPTRRSAGVRRSRAALCASAATVVLAACGSSPGSATPAGPGGSGHIAVVAAENFWGSIASQLGGGHVTVTPIISSPDTDPHAYEPTPADGRAIAAAQYVIVNGVGYDPWAPKLVGANPLPGRRVLTVADIAHRKDGENPHMWYSPAIVAQVIDHITSDYTTLDPADAAFFERQAATFKSSALQYHRLRATIAGKYGGTAVGATEQIFVDLADDLNLNLVTPPGYMKAISAGTDPTAADKSMFDSQVTSRKIKVLVFNRQNSTPDVQTLIGKAHAAGIPVVEITETLDPASARFQDWQSAQLIALQGALAQATGR